MILRAVLKKNEEFSSSLKSSVRNIRFFSSTFSCFLQGAGDLDGVGHVDREPDRDGGGQRIRGPERAHLHGPVAVRTVPEPAQHRFFDGRTERVQKRRVLSLRPTITNRQQKFNEINRCIREKKKTQQQQQQR